MERGNQTKQEGKVRYCTVCISKEKILMVMKRHVKRHPFLMKEAADGWVKLSVHVNSCRDFVLVNVFPSQVVSYLGLSGSVPFSALPLLS